MKLFRTTAAALALTTGLLTLPAQAEEVQTTSGDPAYDIQTPKAFAMIGDLVIARPLLIGATAIGAVAFVVSRLLYFVCYLADWGPLRSLVWAFGMAMIVALFVVSA